MSVLRWDGTATALSSLVHGGEPLGTVVYLRREKFLTPAGTVQVPVVSGNALRAMLRHTAATLLWEALGSPKLTLPVAHALWSGGALVKAKGPLLTGARLADLRAAVPLVGLFGTAGGGAIVDGTLRVGKLVPVCTQTAHVLPVPVTAAGVPDMWDLLQIEYYSRIPSAPTTVTESNFATRNTTDPVAELGVLSDGQTVPPDDPKGAGLMRYGTETFVTGTRFHAWFALDGATPAEVAFFTDVLAVFSQTAVVGGRIGRGHGRLRFDWDTQPVLTEGAGWRDFGGCDRERVLDMLGWLD